MLGGCKNKMNNLFQVILVWLVCWLGMVSANHTILVILGCADSSIQEERVNAALEYVSNSSASIKIYVSGGVKDAILSSNKETEALRMANSFENKGIEIVLDENARNTAENFAYLKQYVNRNYSEDTMPNFVITTSDYHKNRAEQIFNGVLPNVATTWNLSKSSCIDCWKDETIHIHNIKTDVYKALRIIE